MSINKISGIASTNRLLALEEDCAPELVLPRQDVREGNGGRVLVHCLDRAFKAAHLAIVYILACAGRCNTQRHDIASQLETSSCTTDWVMLSSSSRCIQSKGKGLRPTKSVFSSR